MGNSVENGVVAQNDGEASGVDPVARFLEACAAADPAAVVRVARVVGGQRQYLPETMAPEEFSPEWLAERHGAGRYFVSLVVPGRGYVRGASLAVAGPVGGAVTAGERSPAAASAPGLDAGTIMSAALTLLQATMQQQTQVLTALLSRQGDGVKVADLLPIMRERGGGGGLGEAVEALRSLREMADGGGGGGDAAGGGAPDPMAAVAAAVLPSLLSGASQRAAPSPAAAPRRVRRRVSAGELVEKAERLQAAADRLRAAARARQVREQAAPRVSARQVAAVEAAARQAAAVDHARARTGAEGTAPAPEQAAPRASAQQVAAVEAEMRQAAAVDWSRARGGDSGAFEPEVWRLPGVEEQAEADCLRLLRGVAPEGTYRAVFERMRALFESVGGAPPWLVSVVVNAWGVQARPDETAAAVADALKRANVEPPALSDVETFAVLELLLLNAQQGADGWTFLRGRRRWVLSVYRAVAQVLRGDGEPDGDELGDGEPEGDELGDGEPEGDELGDGDAEGDELGEGEPEGDELGEGEPEGDADGEKPRE